MLTRRSDFGQCQAFIIFELIVYAGIGATFGSSLVMLAEALPIEKRSEGQGWANLAIAMGSGGCIILAPLLAHYGISWRWLLTVPAVGIVMLPMMSRMLPESARWEHAAASAAWAGSHFYDVFSPAYQWRTVPLIIATLLGEPVGRQWRFGSIIVRFGVKAHCSAGVSDSADRRNHQYCRPECWGSGCQSRWDG
jgi:MFS family permease